jgi:hypothetical protein
MVLAASNAAVNERIAGGISCCSRKASAPVLSASSRQSKHAERLKTDHQIDLLLS